jgi:nucleotidyltransferase/DNA polymerase involved in DNA repair
MLVKESKTLLREEGRHEKPVMSNLFPAAQAWLDLCSECSSTVEPLAPWEALIDLSAHPRPSEVAAELLAIIHRQEQLDIEAGLSPVTWISRLCAARCDRHDLQWGLLPIEPITDASSYAAELPIGALPGLSPSVSERMTFLGCRFVHQARELSPQTIRRQFGKEAALLSAMLNGQGSQKVKALHPPDSLEVQKNLEGPVDDSLAIDAALGGLAQQLALALGQRDSQAEALTLTAYHEEGPWSSWRRQLGKPILSSSLLLVALRRMVADRPPPRPFVRLTARAEKLTRRSGWQQNLDGSLPATQQKAAIHSAAKNVEAMFGEGRIQTASEVVIPRRLRVLQAWRNATGWR